MNEIDELMLRNPVDFTPEEIEKCVQHFRKLRQNFQVKEQTAAPRSKKPVTAEGMKLAEELDL